MAQSFLHSARSSEFSLAVGDSNFLKDYKIQNMGGEKIADIIYGDKTIRKDVRIGEEIDETRLDCSGLYMLNKMGPRRYDLTGFNLFAILSPCYDVSLLGRNQREMLFVSGLSGSGKSTFAGQYARSYQLTCDNIPKNSPYFRKNQRRVIVISAVTQDEAFDGVDIQRVVFEDLLLDNGDVDEEAIIIEDLENSLCIFDDIDKCANKKIMKFLQHLRDQCLERGRHHNINMLCLNHQLMNYKETKVVLMEATKIVFFPSSGASEQIKRFLKSYGGLDKKQIQGVFECKSRWVMLSKQAPSYILHANGCYFLS